MIAHQGESPAGELHPDLVAPSCVESYMHKTGFTLGQPLEFQPGFFYTAPLTFHHEDLVLFAVLPE